MQKEKPELIDCSSASAAGRVKREGRRPVSAAYWAGYFLRKSGRYSRPFNPPFSPRPVVFSSTTPPALRPSRDLPAAAAMAFAARRRVATSLSDHFSRHLCPSISHLIPPHHDRSESPSSAAPPSPQSPPAKPFPSSLARPSRSRALTSLHLPLPFALHLAAHRNLSTTSSASAPDVDVAARMLTEAASSVPVSELLSDEVVSAAASVPVTPAPYAGEVAAAAAESFPPVAALQYLLDAVQSFTGLN